MEIFAYGYLFGQYSHHSGKWQPNIHFFHISLHNTNNMGQVICHLYGFLDG